MSHDGSLEVGCSTGRGGQAMLGNRMGDPKLYMDVAW